MAAASFASTVGSKTSLREELFFQHDFSPSICSHALGKVATISMGSLSTCESTNGYSSSDLDESTDDEIYNKEGDQMICNKSLTSFRSRTSGLQDLHQPLVQRPRINIDQSGLCGPSDFAQFGAMQGHNDDSTKDKASIGDALQQRPGVGAMKRVPRVYDFSQLCPFE